MYHGLERLFSAAGFREIDRAVVSRFRYPADGPEKGRTTVFSVQVEEPRVSFRQILEGSLTLVIG